MSDGPTLDLGIEGITNAQHIGSGGAADVYRAEQPRLGRSVAVKILRANTSPDNRARFEREAQTLGRLSNHPGIVTLHEAGLTSIGQPFLMMEYCPAGTLADRTSAEGRLAWQEACQIVSEIAEVVDDAHESGVLHRDLKPANVLVDSRGKHLVADFGVAALSDTGNYSAAADFTPGYAPPETLRGDAATPAGDVYSLAATVHALITGRVPFEATDTSNNNVLAWIRRIEEEPPEDLRPLGVPEDVVAIIERGMSKDPADRPTASEFSQQLGAAAEGVVVSDLDAPHNGADPMTTAVASVLPQKPTSTQPPMPGTVPPMPGEPAEATPPMPVGDVSGNTTAVPQLLPQKPTSREVPGVATGPVPPVPGTPATGPVPGTPATGPVPGTPTTGPVPPVPGAPTTGPVPPMPAGPATGPVAEAFSPSPAAPPAAPAPPPTPTPAAAPPVMPAEAPPAEVPATEIPTSTQAPVTGPVAEVAPPAEPYTTPVPAAVPPAQPATTAVSSVLPTGPTTIDRPVVADEDNGGSKKGLLIGVGVGAIALLGGGAVLFSTLTGDGDESAATTTTAPPASSTTAESTTTTEATTTSASTTTVQLVRFGDATAVVGPASIILSGQVPDEETAENIRAAAGAFYSRDQITDELEVDSLIDEINLVLTGNLDDEERLSDVVAAFEGVDKVTVDDKLEFVTTTTTAPPPVTTRRVTTTRRRTTQPPAPTTPPPPVETGNTNPTLG